MSKILFNLLINELVCKWFKEEFKAIHKNNCHEYQNKFTTDIKLAPPYMLEERGDKIFLSHADCVEWIHLCRH